MPGLITRSGLKPPIVEVIKGGFMDLATLKKQLRKWQKTKSVTLATDICKALCAALGVK